MAEADKLVLRGLVLIQHLQPQWVFIENPYTGELRHSLLLRSARSQCVFVSGMPDHQQQLLWELCPSVLQPSCHRYILTALLSRKL